jgi:hypothetical protein
MIKLNRLRWVGHVACIEVKRNAYSVLLEKPNGKSPPKRLHIGRRVILKWILEK